MIRPALLALALAALAGCGSSEPAKPRIVEPDIRRDVPAALRGTVGSEATLRNNEPVLVSGYGLVVGLPGTGGGAVPDRIAASMERELGLKGISKGSEALRGTGIEGMSPRELLRSRDVAIVVVYGAVIPGAPEGAAFDVYVAPVSQSPDVSLEGGILWTTELRLGPPTPFEGMKTTLVGSARGPVFINPFAAATATGPDAAPTRRQGRILGGGVVTNSLDLQLVLDNESHSRARAIAEAINGRFGRLTGAEEEYVARGRSARSIQITVPSDYRARSGDFLSLLTAIQIEQGFPQEFAKRYADALRAEPYLAPELSWALQALPQRAALPFVRELYDASEIPVQLAALRAGAGLNDALAVPHLERLCATGDTPALRAEGARLLGQITSGPQVDLALRKVIAAPELTVRVAAYEALAQRAETAHARRLAAEVERLPAAARLATPVEAISAQAALAFPGETIQGIRRDVVAGKFLLDQAPGGDELVYIAQQGRPRIVLFGDGGTIVRPMVFAAWDDRLLMAADSPTDTIRLRYRKPDRLLDDGSTALGETATARAPADLAGLIEVLARSSGPEDPRPGLGMSYSEVVGTLYALQRAGLISAALAVEEDLLQARLLQATQDAQAADRPETPRQAEERRLRVMDAVKPVTGTQPAPRPAEPLVVPLPQPVPKDQR